MRRAEARIVYEGTDVTASLAPDLLSVSYDEVSDGGADSLSLNLDNRTLKWLNGWLPKAGDRISAALVSHDWHYAGELLTLECGDMKVDDPEFAGPPDTCTVKALNIPAEAGFTDTPADAAWDSITLRELGAQIAARYGMAFVYDAPYDFTLKALKRSNQTDADFLKSTAEKYNLCMKLFSNRLILYSKHIYEQREPVTTIIRGQSGVTSYSFSAPLVGTGYGGVHLVYTPTSEQTQRSYAFTAVQGGKVMQISESVDDDAQAEAVAKGKLREANEKAVSGSLTLPLDLRISAACTVTLQGWGALDGKYFAEKCSHKIGGGASATTVDIHRCLKGDY